jgi:hypothetical protein
MGVFPDLALGEAGLLRSTEGDDKVDVDVEDDIVVEVRPWGGHCRFEVVCKLFAGSVGYDANGLLRHGNATCHELVLGTRWSCGWLDYVGGGPLYNCLYSWHSALDTIMKTASAFSS